MCPVLQHQRVFASIALVVRDHHGCEIRAKADFVHSLRMGEPTPAMTDLKNTSAPPKPSRTAFDREPSFRQELKAQAFEEHCMIMIYSYYLFGLLRHRISNLTTGCA